MNMETTPTSPSSIRIDADRLLKVVLISCIVIELGLFLADAVMTYGGVAEIRGLNRFFNMTREDSLASLLSVIQTLLLSLTLWLIVLAQSGKDIRFGEKFGWFFLALFFTYLTLDDGAEIHERLGTAFEIMVANDVSGGLGGSLLAFFPSYPWQVLFMPVFVVIGLYMLWFLFSAFDDRANFRLFFDGLLLYATAVMLDFFEGLDDNHAFNVLDWLRSVFELRSYTVNHFNKTVEETIEMLGTTLIWLAFLRHFMQQNPHFQLHFINKSAQTSKTT